MKKLLIILLLSVSLTNADVNQAVDNFFSSITADVSPPSVVQNQSAGVLSFGGVATRSKTINLQPMTFTPPSFNASCGNINFYSGSLAFMTNTDQLVQFMQNTLMTAGITAVMTALKAVSPNVAGTLQSMFDAAQKMLNMFNNSCQLGMALGNSADSWMYDRLAKAKSQAHNDSSDASDAEINSTTGGSSATSLTQKMTEVANSYQSWVNQNANLNPNDSTGIVSQMANKYGSVIWKGMQALHLYSLPISSGNQDDVASIANLIISLTGDVIIYSPTNDGTGTAARVIPPMITSIGQFMTSESNQSAVYNCTYFSTTSPGECTGSQVNLANISYPISQFNGGIVATIKIAMNDIQQHFATGSSLTNNDMLIIAISPVPVFAMAQSLDDIGMTASITNFLAPYSEQIAYEILQKLISVSLNLAIEAATARTNNDTAGSITSFTKSITDLQNQVNSYAYKYVKEDPVKIMQDVNYLRSYAQNQMSPQIMQKVNFAKQLGSY